MISDAKAIKAADTLRRYCQERGCNAECIFYNRMSATCQLKVKSPDNYPYFQKKILNSGDKN